MTTDGSGAGFRPQDSSFPGRYAEHDVCRLVTTGRITGRPHDIEIWFGVREGTLYLISGNGRLADWYQNLLSEPRVEVKVGGEVRMGIAHDVTDTPERRVVGEVMGQKYGGWGGDPDIGLTEPDWLWTVPAAAVDRWYSQKTETPTA
jgi:deazaflavin-dependent oxidoreductase (nitroreductase family)